MKHFRLFEHDLARNLFDSQKFYRGYDESIALSHEGTPHEGMIPHSGRFPYGSGPNAYQRHQDFLSTYMRESMKGTPPKEIAEKLGCYDKYKNPSIKLMRQLLSIARNEDREVRLNKVLEYHKQGLGATEIAVKMGMNKSQENTIRNWIDQAEERKASLTKDTANKLKEFVDKYEYVDISSGCEHLLGVNANRFDSAVTYLKDLGYSTHEIRVPQGGDHKTTITVMVPPGKEYSDVLDHKFDIKLPSETSRKLNANGDVVSIGLIDKPAKVDASRVYIRYAEDGGNDRDGTIELRRGVPDISLGKSMYAQVRINVDDSHYLKGMAYYTDDIPEGYDIVFNAKYHKGEKGFYDVIKPMKYKKEDDPSSGVDWENPFGSSVTQKTYIDADGNEKLSALNIVRDMGEWKTKWSNNLASQFLSKQPDGLAKRQLDLSIARDEKEFEEICKLTNPTIKKKLLEDFAEARDAAAEELKAAPFPGQQWHVLMPGPDLKDNEIYAPNYPDGTVVALVRYPHEGHFQIPILTVRNTGSSAAKYLKGAPDAVAMNKTNHDKMSGADDDGDAVVVIPLSDKVKVNSTKTLELLKGFNPDESYPGYEGMPKMSTQTRNTEMGKITNLIMDMTIQGADYETEVARATRHAMTVIDAKKHKLNYKLSEIDNGIAQLKERYQKGEDGKTGARTIISRASSEKDVPERKDWYYSKNTIDPETGEKIITETKKTTEKGTLKAILTDGRKITLKTEGTSGRQYYTQKNDAGKTEKVYVTDDDLVRKQESVFVNKDKQGKQYYVTKDANTGKSVRVYVTDDDFTSGIKSSLKMQKSTQMAEAKDAYEITSGGSKEKTIYNIEHIYADYANSEKDLANRARLEWLKTGTTKSDPDAKVKYSEEIRSLNSKLIEAQSNAPYERQALLYANRVVALAKEENPYMTREEEKKLRGRKIEVGRQVVGARKKPIEVTDREWEAIQAGAISETKLRSILDNTKMDELRQRATPKASKIISDVTKSLVVRMSKAGYEPNQIADVAGISTSSIYNVLKEEGVNFNDR